MKGDTKNGFRLKGWQVYPLRNLLVGPPGEIHIEPKVMQVLESLASNSGQVVEREALLNDIWDGRAFSDEPLTRCIAALRHALDDSAKDPEYIQTIPKSGYRLVCPVESLEHATDDADSGETSVTRKRSLLTGRRRIVLQSFLGLILIAALYVAYRSTLIGPTESPQLTVEGTTQSAPSVYSIAVLPFINMSSDPEQEYFTDGMTEALTAELGRIKALRVISRTSAMHYKATDKLLPEIARELKVDALVEGSVLRAGDEVRITLQLVHGPTDRRLWSESYQRDLRDILSLQGEVTRAIAKEIQITLTPQVETRLARARTVNPEAYQLWFKGNFHLGRLNEESFRKSQALYQEAIDRDPDFAPAYAGLAMAYIALGSWHASIPPHDVFPLAKQAAERALALDPAVAEGHIALARIQQLFDWDWAGAERAFKQGIALNPSTTYGRILYANFLTTMGRFPESIEIGRQTLELDPVSPVAYNELGLPHWFAGRDDEALELYREGLEIDPDFVQSRGLIMLIDVKRGEFDTALTRLAQIDRDRQTLSPASIGTIGHIYGLAGRPAEARAILEELLKRRAQGYVPASSLADIYIGLGEQEEALAWLERAYEERDIRLVWLKESWEYVRLRSNPRFQAILKRMEFPGL